MSAVLDALQCHANEMDHAAQDSEVSAAYARAAKQAIANFANLANTIDAVLVDYDGPLADKLRADLDACVGDAA